MADKKNSSHLGIGMIIGTAIGVAAASFIQSKQGKVLRKDLSKKAAALQKQINTQLKKTTTLTKENYQDLVDKVLSHYEKSKEIAKTEVPAVKKQLLSTWKTIEKEMKRAAEEA